MSIEKRLTDLWKIDDTERNKGVKLLNKVFTNILNNPNDPKFRDLNFTKIRKKLINCRPAFYMLYCAGFNQDVTGTRLQWSFNKMNYKKIQNANTGLQQKIKGLDVKVGDGYGDIIDPTNTSLITNRNTMILKKKRDIKKQKKLQQQQQQQTPTQTQTQANADDNTDNTDATATGTATVNDDDDMDAEMKKALAMSMQQDSDNDNDNDTTMKDATDNAKQAILDQLEDFSVLQIDGTKADEFKMINDPDKGPSAYQWDASAKKWNYVGVITAAQDDNTNTNNNTIQQPKYDPNFKALSVEDQLKAAGLDADDMQLLEDIKKSKGFTSTLNMKELQGLTKEQKVAKFREVRNKYRNEKKQSAVKAKLAKERARREGAKAAQEAKHKREEYQKRMLVSRRKREKAEAARRKKAVLAKIAEDKKRKLAKRARDKAKKEREAQAKLKAQQAAQQQQNQSQDNP